ncbi:MAG: hypothetical protein WA123_04085 [Methylotenera sp.]
MKKKALSVDTEKRLRYRVSLSSKRKLDQRILKRSLREASGDKNNREQTASIVKKTKVKELS